MPSLTTSPAVKSTSASQPASNSHRQSTLASHIKEMCTTAAYLSTHGAHLLPYYYLTVPKTSYSSSFTCSLAAFSAANFALYALSCFCHASFLAFSRAAFFSRYSAYCLSKKLSAIVVALGYQSLLNESLNSVRLSIERPSVNSSVYSISLPTLTPRASMVIFTSNSAKRRNI